MKIPTEIKDFANKIGVKSSIVVTLLSTIMLVSSLIGSEFDYNKFEVLCFFNIIIEFIFDSLYE